MVASIRLCMHAINGVLSSEQRSDSMKKKDKTHTGNQNNKPKSQIKVHKSGISFDSDTWTQLETMLGRSPKVVGHRWKKGARN